jgi:hypothetical protein
LYTLVPEVDASWDADEARTGPSLYEGVDLVAPKLIYTKYRGPDRENLAWGRPKWNIFPIWREGNCPAYKNILKYVNGDEIQSMNAVESCGNL